MADPQDYIEHKDTLHDNDPTLEEVIDQYARQIVAMCGSRAYCSQRSHLIAYELLDLVRQVKAERDEWMEAYASD